MTVVTIDFDIIMAPSIEFYNNLTGNKNFFDDPFTKVFPADFIHYRRLTQWIMSQIKTLNKTDIIFITSHESLINYVSPEDTIINIDHHHDLGYERLRDNNKNYNEINCGNWAEYLLNNNLIKNYIWIKNENSNPNRKCKSTIEEYNFKTYELTNLQAEKIIFCLSPEWVHPQYHNLFFIWVDILNNYYNTTYTIN